jgi:hypothetical protein
LLTFLETIFGGLEGFFDGFFDFFAFFGFGSVSDFISTFSVSDDEPRG